MKFLLNRTHCRIVFLLLSTILLQQSLFAQIEIFIVDNPNKSDTFTTMEPAAKRWFETNRKSDDKEDQNTYKSCKRSESGSSVIVVYQRTWVNRAGEGGAAKPEKVTDAPTEETTGIRIETIERLSPAVRPRSVIIETSSFSPSGKMGTRSFRQVMHKSGLITIIETGVNERVVEVKADLSASYLNKGTEPTDAGRRFIQTLGKRDDDAGHVIANRLGGSGSANAENLFPQLPNINRGEFAQWEATIAKQLEDTKNKVSIDIAFNYDPKDSRPTGILYNVTVNGKVGTKLFLNKKP